MYILLALLIPYKKNSNIEAFFKDVTEKGYPKDNEEYKKLSDEAKDLIDKFLTINPEERINVKDALNHKWFEGIKKNN